MPKDQENKIRSDFRQKFHQYEMEDPRDVHIEHMSGDVEDWWLTQM